MLARFEQAKVRKVLSSPTVVDHLGREAMHYVSGAADVYCVIRMPDWAKDAAAETAAYVLHVEVVPPSGKVRFHFKRSLMTQGGRAHLVFPLAFNDEPGEWKIRVTEPLTGVTAERALSVR